jgi:hypothetical protein
MADDPANDDRLSALLVMIGQEKLVQEQKVGSLVTILEDVDKAAKAVIKLYGEQAVERAERLQALKPNSRFEKMVVERVKQITKARSSDGRQS